MKGGAQDDPRNGDVGSGVGDVRDMNLWVDGRMERGDAQILPPPGVANVPEEGGKRMRKR